MSEEHVDCVAGTPIDLPWTWLCSLCARKSGVGRGVWIASSLLTAKSHLRDFVPSMGMCQQHFQAKCWWAKPQPFTIALPVSQDPFKRPENDRVKALRFTASIVPGELAGPTPPYYPTPPTLWRHNIDEVEPDKRPLGNRSPLWKSLLSSSSSSSETTKVCTLTF